GCLAERGGRPGGGTGDRRPHQRRLRGIVRRSRRASGHAQLVRRRRDRGEHRQRVRRRGRGCPDLPPMSARQILERADPPLVWIDMIQPTPAELEEVARTYGLQPTSVSDCLDPGHLPKFEQFETYTFVIIRSFDER